MSRVGGRTASLSTEVHGGERETGGREEGLGLKRGKLKNDSKRGETGLMSPRSLVNLRFNKGLRTTREARPNTVGHPSTTKGCGVQPVSARDCFSIRRLLGCRLSVQVSLVVDKCRPFSHRSADPFHLPTLDSGSVRG